MIDEIKLAEELMDFIYKSPTAFHVVSSIKKILDKNGFKELKEEDKWHVIKYGKYYITKNDSAIAAFICGRKDMAESGFRIIGSHTDSPTFRIKPCPEIVSEEAYVKLNTEVYGSPILNTWLDRPLSAAGRVALKSMDIMKPEARLINIKKPILVIPNLAIHLNKNVNSGVELNRQKDTLPLLGMIQGGLEKNDYLVKLICEELDIKREEILDFDLFLYEFEKGSVVGLNNEFISSSRLDDLAMVHAGLKALLTVETPEATNVLVCFDNEEVGSRTKQGAASPLLENILERLITVTGGSKEDYIRALARSFMISGDMAHAVHPNSGEKADPVNRPVINKGPVIKISANQSYTSDSLSSAVYSEICRRAGVPVQKFVNRSDLPGGSTIGPISSTHLNINSVDIGNPILSMHSIRELGGVKDHFYVLRSFEEFYKA